MRPLKLLGKLTPPRSRGAHEGGHADARSPATASAAEQVLQRGLLHRVYPPSFALERSVGPRGRHSYSTATKLRVIEYTRLRRRRREKSWSGGRLGQGLCLKRIREWVRTEENIMEVGVGKQKRLMQQDVCVAIEQHMHLAHMSTSLCKAHLYCMLCLSNCVVIITVPQSRGR